MSWRRASARAPSPASWGTHFQQPTFDESRERRHNGVIAATGEGDQLGHRSASVYQRQQGHSPRVTTGSSRTPTGSASTVSGDGTIRHAWSQDSSRLRASLTTGSTPSEIPTSSGARFINGEREIAFAPPQEVEDCIDHLLGDQATQEVWVDRTCIEQSAAHADSFIGGPLDCSRQFRLADAGTAHESARQCLATIVGRRASDATIAEVHRAARGCTLKMQPARLLRKAQELEDVRKAEGIE